MTDFNPSKSPITLNIKYYSFKSKTLNNSLENKTLKKAEMSTGVETFIACIPQVKNLFFNNSPNHSVFLHSNYFEYSNYTLHSIVFESLGFI